MLDIPLGPKRARQASMPRLVPLRRLRGACESWHLTASILAWNHASPCTKWVSSASTLAKPGSSLPSDSGNARDLLPVEGGLEQPRWVEPGRQRLCHPMDLQMIGMTVGAVAVITHHRRHRFAR